MRLPKIFTIINGKLFTSNRHAFLLAITAVLIFLVIPTVYNQIRSAADFPNSKIAKLISSIRSGQIIDADKSNNAKAVATVGETTPSPDDATRPLDFITYIELSEKKLLPVMITQDSVEFNASSLGECYPDCLGQNIGINKQSYPKLFAQGPAGFSAIAVDKYIDPKTKSTLVELSNMQPDHGGMVSTYVLHVDPFTGSIKEVENYYDSSDYKAWLKQYMKQFKE